MKAYSDHTDNLVALKRIEGQVRGVQRMIKDDKNCLDVLTQISAVKGALNRIEEKIFVKYFQKCISNAAKATKKEKLQRTNEILTLIHRIREV